MTSGVLKAHNCGLGCKKLPDSPSRSTQRAIFVGHPTFVALYLRQLQIFVPPPDKLLAFHRLGITLTLEVALHLH